MKKQNIRADRNKLALRKETLRTLTPQQVAQAHGGAQSVATVVVVITTTVTTLTDTCQVSTSNTTSLVSC